MLNDPLKHMLGVQAHIHTVRLKDGQIEVTLKDAEPVSLTPQEALSLAKGLKRIAKPVVGVGVVRANDKQGDAT